MEENNNENEKPKGKTFEQILEEDTPEKRVKEGKEAGEFMKKMLESIKAKEPPFIELTMPYGCEHIKIRMYSNGMWEGLPIGTHISNDFIRFELKLKQLPDV